MYAVLMTGGKQYRVEAGSTLVVEKIGGEPGSSVTFERILLVGDGDAVTVGSPTVAGASVSATVLGEALGPKIVVFKFKQKVKYRRRTGHRQHLTRLRIDSISADGKTVKAQPPEPAAPKAAATPARTPRRAVKAQAAKPTRRQAATEAVAPAEPKPKPSRRRVAPKASGSTEQGLAAPKRARRTKASSETETTEAAEEASSAQETKPKPRTRRTAKPDTESAKEE